MKVPNRFSRRAMVSAIAATAVVIGSATAIVTGASSQALAATAPAITSFPSASTTGVPVGTVLAPMAGFTNTTCGTVVSNKVISGDVFNRAKNGTHSATTPCLTLKNVLVKGEVHNGYSSLGYGPVLAMDSEIAVPVGQGGNSAAFDQANIYGWRLNIHGARSGVQCDGYCEIHDSYVQADYFQSPAHMDAYISNGAYGAPQWLDHSTWHCSIGANSPGGSPGGCSADVGFFGDFSAINNVKVTNNLFKADSAFYYCVYTGTAQPSKPHPVGDNNTWSGNVFERGGSGRCGGAGGGPVYDPSGFGSNGNVSCNNLWEDSATAIPNTSGCGTPPPPTTTTVPSPTTVTTVTLPPPPSTTTTVVPPTTTTTKPPQTTTTTTVPPLVITVTCPAPYTAATCHTG